MPDRSLIRMAVWGIGYHARKNVLPAIACCDAVTLAGVCSRNQQGAQDVSDALGAPFWAKPEEMLTSPDVDAVYLCTPIGLHYEQGLSVIRSGKHLLCEKALTSRAKQSLQLVAEARARNVALCEAFMYMFHPQFQALVELLGTPEFGEIAALSCWFGMPRLEKPGFRHSRELGGGGFLDLACYPMSLAARLFDGQPRVRSAAVGNAAGDEVDMTGHATLQFSTGAIAHLDWGFGRAYRNEVSIWGMHKSLYADRIFSKSPDYPSHIYVRDQRGEEGSIKLRPTNAFEEMLNAFAASTRDSELREKLWAVVARQAEVVGSVEAAIHDQSGFFG